MSSVNIQLEQIEKQISEMQSAALLVNKTRAYMNKKYQNIGGEWRDQNYNRLGQIVSECNTALINLEKIFWTSQKSLLQIKKEIIAYEETNIDILNNTLNATNYSEYNEEDTVSLSDTFISLVPDRESPRDLVDTQYGFSIGDTGEMTYDSPLEMANYLYYEQGSANPRFQGTCGLCSIANVLRLAGVNASENEIIDYASKGGLFSALCTVNPLNPSKSGGTTPNQRRQILDYFGISSSTWSVKTDNDGNVSMETINDLGKWISEGRGVIIDVDAGAFYDSPRYNGLGHAVTVTSVTHNSYGDVSGFYIADSNRGTIYYPAWRIQESMRPVDINVTSQIIR